MRASWLGDVLRAAGLEVIKFSNPRGRGSAAWRIEGVVGHDTVTPPSVSDTRTASILRDGHSTLKGPLAQLGVDRQGRVWWIADGRCNHNGFGEWGNNSIGIEVFANGGGNPKEPWNAAQQQTVVVATRAILDHLGLPVRRFKGHKETDPRRKIDPYQIDMNSIRKRVEQHLSVEEDIMRLGDKGDHVSQWQHTLSRFIYQTGGGLDGGGTSHDRGGRHLRVTGTFDQKTHEFTHHAILRAERWVLKHPIYGKADVVTPTTQAFIVTALRQVMGG